MCKQRGVCFFKQSCMCATLTILEHFSDCIQFAIATVRLNGQLGPALAKPDLEVPEKTSFARESPSNSSNVRPRGSENVPCLGVPAWALLGEKSTWVWRPCLVRSEGEVEQLLLRLPLWFMISEGDGEVASQLLIWLIAKQGEETECATVRPRRGIPTEADFGVAAPVLHDEAGDGMAGRARFILHCAEDIIGMLADGVSELPACIE